MKDFIDTIINYKQLKNSENLAIGVIIAIEGSSFRRTGVRFLIQENGRWHCGEESDMFQGDTLRQVKQAIASNTTTILNMDTAHPDGQSLGIGLGYRGVIRLFINPINEAAKKHPITIMKKSLTEMNHRILMTVTQADNCKGIQAGEQFLYENEAQLAEIIPNNDLVQALQQGAEQCWIKGRLALTTFDFQKGEMEVFYEILTQSPHLVLFGSQYDVYPLANIAKSIGWRVTVVANPDKLRKNLFEIVDKVIALEETHLLKTDAYTAFILMSHIFERDMAYLKAAIETKVPYIGMLGPPRRFTRMFGQLAEEGFTLSDQDQKRLFAPMGLNIGAATQEEIAISLIAEVRAFFSNRKGGFLNEWDGNVHDR